MKQQPDKDMLVLGGATLVSSLMKLGWIDELRLIVIPLVLGKGKPLFMMRRAACSKAHKRKIVSV